MDATGNYNASLTVDRLFAWHAALFPTGRIGMQRITVGGWRNESRGTMQVVSGPVGSEKIHYEAPAYDRLAVEMTRFIRWFNTGAGTSLVYHDSSV